MEILVRQTILLMHRGIHVVRALTRRFGVREGGATLTAHRRQT
jgi:hypothetical protein